MKQHLLVQNSKLVLNNNQLVAHNTVDGILENGLAMYYDVSSPISYPGTDTTWNDLSVNEYTATLYNGITYNSNNGGAFVLDGTSDYIATNNTTNYSTFTIFYVFKNRARALLTIANQHIINKNSYYAVANNDWPVGHLLDYSGLILSMNISAGNSTIITAPEHGSILSVTLPSLDQWLIIGHTYDGVTSKAYCNEQLVASKASPPPASNSRAWTFGRAAYANQPSWANITLAVMAIYNRALSEAEYLSNYNNLKSRFGL